MMMRNKIKIPILTKEYFF